MTSQPSNCETLFQQHERWLRRVVRHRILEAHVVSDILQETALALVNSYPDVPDPVAPWLYRVTVRQILLYRRRRGRQRKLSMEYAEHQRVTGESELPDPRSWVLEIEERDSVREAIERLPELDQQILLLKHTENWTYEELAEHLGVKTGTIEYRLIKARRRLRNELFSLQLEVAR